MTVDRDQSHQSQTSGSSRGFTVKVYVLIS